MVEGINPDVWRKEKFWNEECDNVFKFYKEITDYIFDKYSVRT